MFIVLVYILFCAAFMLWQRSISKARKHPLPPAFLGNLPVIGHAHYMLTDSEGLWQLFVTVSDYANRHGGVIHGTFAGDIYYVITDPDDALTVANTCMQKHYTYDFFKSWLGQGLITSSGAIWQRHRKLLNSAFSLPTVHGFLGIFNEQAKLLVQKLEPFAEKPPFLPSPYIRTVALETSCMTVFGSKDVIKDEKFYSKYAKSMEDMLHYLMKRGQTVWLHSDIICKLLGYERQELRIVKTLTGLSEKVIKDKIAANNKTTSEKLDYTPSNEKHKSFIDIMLEKLNNGLNEKEIREELDTTIFAGFETSYNLLQYAIVLLGSFPAVQEKVYREILEVVGCDRDVGKEDLQKLVYTDAVIKETLRCLPVIPAILRYIDRDVKLKNYTLRAKTQCLILTYGVQRDTSWGSGVNDFRPERWLDPSVATNAFAAFGLGKRSCAGRTYALTSAKVMLSHMVRTYKITADYSKMKFKIDITLNPVEGHEVMLERRN